MGGSTNSGITSGLDTPRQQYNDAGRVQKLFEERKAMFDKLNPNQRSGFMPGSASSFLTNFGLNLMSQTPRGNIFSTAALAAKEPFQQFQSARTQERADQKQLDQAILGDVISEDFKSTQQQKLIDAGFEEKRMELENEIKELTVKGDQESLMLAEGLKNDIILLEKDYELQKKYGTSGKSYDPGAATKTSNLIKSLDDEKLALNEELSEKLGILTGDRTAEDNLRIKQIQARLGSIDDIRSNILKESSLIEKIGALEQTDQLNTIVDQNMAKGMTYEEAFKAALEQFKFLQNMADGGRAGYNVGGMTGMAAPQQTQQSVEASPTQDLTYAELRSRLPNSISDQVVQLLANSKQALLDFAEIRTQQDITEFNQQYDVSLTLPQEG